MPPLHTPTTPETTIATGRTRSRGSVFACLVVAALSLAACGGATVDAEDALVPERLALDESTTTTAAETTTSETSTPEPTTPETEPEVAESTETTEVPADSDPAAADPAPADPAPADSVPADSVPAAAATGADDRSFQLLNELRASLGLNPLVRDATMDEFARSWSAEMGDSGNFEHSDAPYGENIAFASDTSQSGTWAAETFNTNWIDSPGHYANMTNANYTTIGVGIVLTDSGWYGTHVFK